MKHPIRVVAARTGLSTHVIRVWERRYEAVTPIRTDTNRRLYTDANIERLNLLQRAIKRGRGIGQIARLSTEELSRLVAEDQALSREEPAVGETVRFEPRTQGRRSEEEIVSACLNAIEALDAPSLDRILSQAAVVFSKPLLLQNILMPLLYIIGDQWRDGTLRIAHEHIASAVIRSFLSGLSHTYSPATGAPGIIVTTPAGQLHEFGALMIADVATAAGWKITYLGPNLPSEEIAAAAHQQQALVVAVSLVYPADDAKMPRELRKLRRYLPPETSILIGGRAAVGYQDIIDEIEATRLESLVDVSAELERLRAHATPRRDE